MYDRETPLEAIRRTFQRRSCLICAEQKRGAETYSSPEVYINGVKLAEIVPVCFDRELSIVKKAGDDEGR